MALSSSPHHYSRTLPSGHLNLRANSELRRMTTPPQRPDSRHLRHGVAEVEQSGCYGSEEAGSGAHLPIRSIFLHIAAAVHCRVLVRRLRRRRRGVARQLVLCG
uniref:Uncharacterized protein n=1 Tax=Oryza barthii TaxID=65489 RepID=A0A0D3GX94_9ORYZ